jgi:hypothetical protein
MMKQIDIKKILKERGSTGKLEGNVPEGFVLVHENTLEDLKDFEIWKEWKNNQLTIKEMNNKHFDNG